MFSIRQYPAEINQVLEPDRIDFRINNGETEKQLSTAEHDSVKADDSKSRINIVVYSTGFLIHDVSIYYNYVSP